MEPMILRRSLARCHKPGSHLLLTGIDTCLHHAWPCVSSSRPSNLEKHLRSKATQWLRTVSCTAATSAQEPGFPLPVWLEHLLCSGARETQRLPGRAREIAACGLGGMIWLWVKKVFPKWNPGKWKHGLNPAVPWYFINFDPNSFLADVEESALNQGAQARFLAIRPATGVSFQEAIWEV